MDLIARARAAIASLTGEQLLAEHSERALGVLANLDTSPIGYSQFNEILLCCGFDRINPDYFDYLFSGQLNPTSAPRISSVEQIESASGRGQRLALLGFGNVRFGFKAFAKNDALVSLWFNFLTPITTDRFENRLSAAIPVEEIPVDKRDLLGYISGDVTIKKLAENPTNVGLQAERAEQLKWIEVGKRNQHAYLVSHHLDIYVATSMRQKHEYAAVASFCHDLFQQGDLIAMNLRYFDPTLAYAPDRIDKGLSEALMLKRARVTIFLAQETDTLGKDSELACTLAQGKVVIAYVPTPDDAFFEQMERQLHDAYPSEQLAVLLLRQLKYFSPALAWENGQVQKWLTFTDEMLGTHVEQVRQFFRQEVRALYEKRAEILRDKHPLGIQVHLEDGVAGGVLVVRSINDCARLVKAVLTNTMQFNLRVERKTLNADPTHLSLVETISGSIYRVMTHNRPLEKAFWNFYLAGGKNHVK